LARSKLPTRDLEIFYCLLARSAEKRGADVDFQAVWAHVSNQEHQVSPRGASDWWRESVRKSVSLHQDKIRGSAISRWVSHLTELFADVWGPDERDREVDRWHVCLNSCIGLSECGPLPGKPFTGSSSQVVNPATSPSPFPIPCDLPTEKNKYSRFERSGFAEPAHIAAGTLSATHRRTRCALKRFADGSQPTLLGMRSHSRESWNRPVWLGIN